MNSYTEDLIRREAQLEEMRRDEKDDQTFLFGLMVVMAAVGGATFTLFVVALAVLMVFLGSFSLRVPTPGAAMPPTANAIAVAPTDTLPAPVASPVEQTTVVPAATPIAEPPPLVDPLAAATAAPPPAPVLPPVQPQATPAAPFNSGGLGLSRPEWETMYGLVIEPGLNRYGDPGVYTQDVTYVDELVIAVTWQTAQPIIVEDAMNVGNSYVPPDGQYVTSYAPPGRPDTNVDVYISQSLAARLGADSKWWNGSDPGAYIVQYTRTPTGISSITVSTGNTP